MADECVITGCDGVAKCRKMCQAHYCRWLRTGNPGSAVIPRRRRASTGRIPNKGLGHLGDDPDRLMSAVAYLLQHKNLLIDVGL